MSSRRLALRGVLVVVLLGSGFVGAPAHADYRAKLRAIEEQIDTIPQLGRHEITLDYYAGAVTLRGRVQSERVRQEVELAASRVKGITRVVNRLEIEDEVPTADARARFGGGVTNLSDAEIQRELSDAMRRAAPTQEKRIEVSVLGGRAIISGDVESFRKVDELLAVALNTRGVEDIENHLTVGGREYHPERFLRE